MKLLFVFTGGTIGSAQSGNLIDLENGRAYKIIDAYNEKYGIDFEYDISEPYTELSENNTGRHIRALIGAVKQGLDKDYDGVIIAHGSDTLQYSAAALGYCLGNSSMPICIVASNAPIESKDSNALENLRGAVEVIKNKYGRGVFAVYRNSSSKAVTVHRATRLIASKAYSDELASVYESPYGVFDGNFDFIKSSDYQEREDEISDFDASVLSDYSNEILVLYAYAGMIYPEIPEEVKYILLNTYHSGTLNVKSERTIEFLQKARERKARVFATGVADGAQYASASEYKALGIEPIKALSPIAAYVKLWLGISNGKDVDSFIERSLGGDL